MKNTKGITLIALIITIIIMLILVAVSINIAINTGLFKSAGDATKNWKVAQEEESYGGTLEVDGKRYNSVEEYMKDINSKIEMDYTVENGYIEVTVLYKGEEPTLEEYEQYMRPLLEGKDTPEKQQMFLDSENFWAEIDGNPKFESLNDALESYNYSTWDEFVENEGNGDEDQALINLDDVCPQYSCYVITLPDGTKKVEVWFDYVNSVRVFRTIKVEYRANEPGEYEFKAELFGSENSRKIRISLNQLSIAYNDALKQLKPGDYVIYDTEIEGVGEITCRVLYDATSPYGLQIVTDDCIQKDGEYVYIPFGNINWMIYDNPGKTFNEKFKNYDFSEWYNYESMGTVMYNNAISILNNKAMEFCNKKYMLDARCVGSYPGNKERETKSFAVIPDGVIKNETGITDAKDEDDNYENDYNQLQANNILETNKHYWFASRYNEVGPVYYSKNGLIFSLRTDGASEYSGSGEMILITEHGTTTDGGVYDKTKALWGVTINAFRPVFTLKGNLNVVSGDGKSESTAYRLGV